MIFASCSVTEKIKTAADAFDRKQYFIAASLYEKEFEQTTNPAQKAKLAYGAGVSYRCINETSQASNWFRQAANLNFGDQAWKDLGNSLIQQGLYDEAIQIFETAQNKKGSEDFKTLVSLAKQAKSMASEKLNFYSVKPLGINTAASEYAPALDHLGHLIFTSDRPSANGIEIYKWTGRKFADLYSAHPDESNAELFSNDINSANNEGTACFNATGNIMLFTRSILPVDGQTAYNKIYMSLLESGKWSQPVALAFQKEGINYRQPCLAVHDSVMFFSSDDVHGEGKYDLYYAEWDGQQWNNPERLGKRVNTQYDEQFPFMYEDTLYFASDRPGGLGGLDIYKTYSNEDGEWQPPINLRSPINSNEDDFALVIDPISEQGVLKGYFSTSRIGGMGKDDIYSFERTKPDESVFIARNEVPIANPEKPEKKIKYQVFLAIKVFQAMRENPEDPNSKIRDKKPLPNTPVLLKEGDVPIQLRTNDKGNAFTEIKYDQDYFAIAVSPGLLNASKTFTTKNGKNPNEPLRTINIEIVLDKAYTGKEILISDIYYDLDKWDIRKDAEPSLNQLVQLLKDNPKVKIQLSSHTDCRATDAYNLDLSNKRAKSAVDYLSKNGIEASRLTPQGYGESKPITTCVCEKCTEEEHQKNRRTTFTILE